MYNTMSYGRLSFDLMPHLKWVTMPKSSGMYSVTSGHDGFYNVVQVR